MSSTLNNDDDSFSSDSGDEFLTLRSRGGKTSGGGGNDSVDREAMIRKKLLETFYGKSSTRSNNDEDTRSKDSMISDDEDDDDDSNPPDPLNVDDMDTPQFNAAEHTQKHVWGTPVHPLLEIEETLACQVRTLDSRLQTLVYENYSRFIEATDAIRSIGVSVQANQGNLSSLQGSMDKVQETSRAVEASVGPLRDQVVEKIRVHRLLQRLDTLLKLPSTLRQQIHAGKYRLATKSYVSAYSILSKHSTGFESLQRIETECHAIMTELLKESSRRLYHWSGGNVPSLKRRTGSEDNVMDEDGILSAPDAPSFVEENDEGQLPDPPQTIVDIMECAAAPVLVMQSGSTIQTGLTLSDCQDMALSACLRFLERILDSHHIELQEQLSPVPTTTTTTASGGTGNEGSTRSMIPTAALDSILEVATLYTMSFNNDENETRTPNESKLTQFVFSAFSLFLVHVRSELLEQARLQQQHASRARAAAKKVQTTSKRTGSHRKTPSEHAASDEMMRLADAEAQAEEESDHYDEQIATSMATLLLSVRQLASGLSMVPNGAVPPDAASSLVEQTVGLTEEMVRRRVDQKFYSLRLRVVEDCFSPFCQAVKDMNEADEAEDQPPALLGCVQLASVALSDSLQLVDDTVRSILANLEEEKASENGDGTTTDDSMLREAVRQSTTRFAKWLALAMEVLAGYESSTNPKQTMVAAMVRPEQHSGDDDGAGVIRPQVDQKSALDSGDDASDGPAGDSSDDVVEDALLDLLANHMATQDMVLAIAEMCRVAERSVADQIRQSISIHGGGTPGAMAGANRKASTGTLLGDSLFTVDESQKSQRSTNDPISKRFRLAASRVLTLYAMNVGHTAATLLCSSLPDVVTTNNPTGPRSVVSSVLELIKASSKDCADLFGGSRRAGPIPESLEDEYTSLTSSRMKISGGRRSGLAFDVERMFVEKVVIYPHPNEVLDFQRNAVVTIIGKVAFQALMESSRLLRFSVGGYRQIKVDTEFFRWSLPHFVKDEAMSDGSNTLTSLNSLLTEVYLTARDRCPDRGILKQEVEETNLARATIRAYMSSQYGSSPPDFCCVED